MPPKFIYKLEGESISLKKIPAELIGRVLVNVQSLIYSVGRYSWPDVSVQGRRPKIIEDLYSLNVGFSEGCVELQFNPSQIQYSLEDPSRTIQEPAFSKLAILFGVLSGPDDKGYDDVKGEVKKIIEDPKTRVAILNHINRIIPPSNMHAKVKIEDVHLENPEIDIQHVYFRERVLKLLEEETENDEVKIRGAIVRIKDDVPNSLFWVKRDSGSLAKVCLPEDMRSQIIGYLADRTPVSISGIGQKIGRTLEIIELDSIKESAKIIIDTALDIKLQTPIEATLSYERYDEDDEFWVVSNNELGINGVDETVDKAREIFEESLYEDYLVYKDIEDNRLSDKALLLKKQLIDLFEYR